MPLFIESVDSVWLGTKWTTPQTTFLMVDSFQCGNGVPLVISVSDILANDKVLVGSEIVENNTVDLLEVVGIKKVMGGNVSTTSFNGKISSIIFLNTGFVGSIASFVCEIKNKTTNEIFQEIVNIEVKASTPITAIHDVYNVIQWGTLNLTKQMLLMNDVVTLFPPITFVEVVPDSVVRGTVEVSGDDIIFTSTGFAGQSAGFQYKIKDAQNNISIGNVNINILSLPTIEAYLFSSTDIEAFKSSYTPPTLTEVFNTWARISNDGLYFPPGTTPTGEAAAWKLYGSGFRCTVNSAKLTGFISPKSYNTYTHEATLSSSDADNDTIALIVAFKRDGSTNKVLLAVREPGGMVEYAQNTSWSLATNINGVVEVIAKLTSYSIVRKTGGWSTVGATRVKIERIGSMITAYCSQFKSTSILTDSKLEIDLNDYPELAWALEDCPYGYACHSQLYATYSNVVFNGGLNSNEIFDFDLNCTWEYINNTWVQNTTKTIQTVLGYPRTVINPNNGYTYQIEQDSITRIN